MEAQIQEALGNPTVVANSFAVADLCAQLSQLEPDFELVFDAVGSHLGIGRNAVVVALKVAEASLQEMGQ